METLPSEVITSILKYLTFDDRRQMSLINKTWYYASLHPKLLNEEVFVFHSLTSTYDFNDSDVIQKLRTFEQVLLDSKRSLFHLKFQSGSLNDVTIFETLGDRIVSLDLILDYFTDSYLDSITNCKNLQTLQLKNIDVLSIVKSSRKPLMNLNSLTIMSCHISDMSFNAIVQCAPSLMDICIVFNDILECPQSIRTYYPNYKSCKVSTCFDSDAVFTSVNIINYLKYTKNVKELQLTHYLLFSNLPKHIKLKSLILNICSPDINARSCNFLVPPNSNMQSFILTLNQQTTLERLELYTASCWLLTTVLKLHKLKYLKLDFDMDFNCENSCLQTFVNALWNLKYIRTFIFSINPMPSNCVKGIVAEIPNCTLKSLTSLDCPLENSLKIIQFGKHLTMLRIQMGCNLKTCDLQLLFKNLTNLMHLSIDQCINLDDDVFLSLPISNIKGLVSLKIKGANLSYHCLQNIELSYLKILSITYITIPDMESNDYANFQVIFEKFGNSVPALTSLSFQIKCCPLNNKRNINTQYLRSYFSKIKQLFIYC